jgi:hypothetical protein
MTETLFKDVNRTVNLLIQSIEMGSIGLPDIQRRFVYLRTRTRPICTWSTSSTVASAPIT